MNDQELGKLFARKVLGWKEDAFFWAEGIALKVRFEDWHPCTDMNQAMLGIDRLATDGWLPNLGRHAPQSVWAARLLGDLEHEQYQMIVHVEDNHPAKAIVKACLKAVEVEIEA